MCESIRLSHPEALPGESRWCRHANGGNGRGELMNFLGAIAVLDLLGKDGSRLTALLSAGDAMQLRIGQPVHIDLLEVAALAL